MMLACCSHGVNVSGSSSLSLFSQSIVLPTSFTSSTAAIVTLYRSLKGGGVTQSLELFCWYLMFQLREQKNGERKRL